MSFHFGPKCYCLFLTQSFLEIFSLIYVHGLKLFLKPTTLNIFIQKRDKEKKWSFSPCHASPRPHGPVTGSLPVPSAFVFWMWTVARFSASHSLPLAIPVFIAKPEVGKLFLPYSGLGRSPCFNFPQSRRMLVVKYSFSGSGGSPGVDTGDLLRPPGRPGGGSCASDESAEQVPGARCAA